MQYLVWVLAAFEERDQRLADLARTQPSGREPHSAALVQALARPGNCRETLALLEAAAGDATMQAPQAWDRFARYFNELWDVRRAALDELLVRNPRIADWRAVSAIDADSVLTERARYAELAAQLPAGALSLAPAEPPR